VGLFGKRKIKASEVAHMFLVSVDEMLKDYWPKMAAKIAPTIGMQPEDICGEKGLTHIYLAIVATHYHDLPKLFDEELTDSLRRDIWYELTREEHGLGDILQEYFRSMEAGNKDGELYLSIAASLLYEKLGGDLIIQSNDYKMASPTAILAITELLVIFDLDWWKNLKAEFKILP